MPFIRYKGSQKPNYRFREKIKKVDFGPTNGPPDHNKNFQKSKTVTFNHFSCLSSGIILEKSNAQI